MSGSTSAAVRAIADRYEHVQSLFRDNFALIQSTRARALSELVPSLTASLKLQDEDVSKLEDYLRDIPSIFRHARRAKFHAENTLQALRETLEWRITSEVDNLDVDELHPLYVDPPSVARALRDAGGPSAAPSTTDPIANRPPLFWINDRLKDRFGRPCGVISLRTLERTDEGNLESLKEYILASVEIVRRHIAELYAKSEPLPESTTTTPETSPSTDQGAFQKQSDKESGGDGKHGAEGQDDDVDRVPRSGPLQIVLACDLDGAGMSNLEIELLPFLLDLLKKHYPGHIATLYLLHYGWVHAGMWTLAKRVLPQPVLNKIIFPKDDGSSSDQGGKRGDIEDYFDRRRWPHALGKCGDWNVLLDEAHNSVMRRYSSSVTKRPRSRSHSLSRHSSRSSSFVNLHQLGAFTPMDEKGNALGPWAAPSTPGASLSTSSGVTGHNHGVGGHELGAWGAYAGASQPPVRRRWRDLFRTLTYLFVLRILTLNRRMRRRVVNLGRVVGRSLVTGGQDEADERPGRWNRHAGQLNGGNSRLAEVDAVGASGGGGLRKTGRPHLHSLQMSVNRLTPPSSPNLSSGVRSPVGGRSNVRYPTGWGHALLQRDSQSISARQGRNSSVHGQRHHNLRLRFLWRSSMQWMRSLTLFALIVALLQSDWRTSTLTRRAGGLEEISKAGVGAAALWNSVKAAAILGAGTAAIRS
ncbi:hypothetical protein OC846_003594 [Tilletia horrida]|uniref:CRAL-TRIO domain-containing protein n=1 Tax=Tilletia horrida TaxID=155126 RepID=A0AAN6GRW0_9BASI|nr:hypothetical protein OC846_003594 [Tilletia horrida]KAK0550895.1 hypothetical protein OC845_002458 [Tilletia horrida]KAK0565729.1 hypothetical protein OC861_003599 [Tilletia horrida]